MSKPYVDFEPKWFKGKIPSNSYRSIFKWGDPAFVKVPKENLYKMLKKRFGMTDADFDHYSADLGLDEVNYSIPSKVIKDEDVSFLRLVYGNDFVRTDSYARLSVAYGKTMALKIKKSWGRRKEGLNESLLLSISF